MPRVGEPARHLVLRVSSGQDCHDETDGHEGYAERIANQGYVRQEFFHRGLAHAPMILLAEMGCKTSHLEPKEKEGDPYGRCDDSQGGVSGAGTQYTRNYAENKTDGDRPCPEMTRQRRAFLSPPDL